MVFLTVAIALVGDEIDFRPRPPKAGSFVEYRMSYRTKSTFTSDEFHSRFRIKTLGVRPDGSYTMGHESFGGYAIYQGKERVAIKPTPLSVTNHDPLGRPVKRDEPLVVTEPMDRVSNGVTRFYAPSKPLKPGDKYGKILNSNDGEGYNDATQQFEVVGKEKWKGQDVMRIAFTYAEKHTKVYFEGYWLFRMKDAQLVVFRAKGTDVPYVLNLPAGDATITSDLVAEG